MPGSNSVACSARRHRSGDARFETTDDQAAVAQQLEEERLVADAEIFFLDQRGGKPGELRDPLDDALAHSLGEACAGVERAEILLRDERFGGCPGGCRRCAELAGELAMILRDAREAGQEERIREVVARSEMDTLQVHRTGHE